MGLIFNILKHEKHVTVIERPFFHNHFKSRTAQRPYIGLLPVLLAIDNFGSHRIGCSHYGVGDCFTNFGNPKITDFNSIILCKEQVLGFNITMQNIFSMNQHDSQATLSYPVHNDIIAYYIVSFIFITVNKIADGATLGILHQYIKGIVFFPALIIFHNCWPLENSEEGTFVLRQLSCFVWHIRHQNSLESKLLTIRLANDKIDHTRSSLSKIFYNSELRCMVTIARRISVFILDKLL
mmetsp:Transcript_17300/g.19495  ORF Transcript_17300/g.19495 Transcript_17300/m.19495 type:complete len:238 (+) Transcript_17300:15-728(+)